MRIEEFLISIKELAAKNGLSEPFMVGGVSRDRIMGRIGEKNEIKDLDITCGNEDSHKLGFLLSKAYPKSVYREFDDGHTSLDVFNLHIDLSSHFVIPGIESELTRMGITDQSEAVKELFSRDFTMNTILENLDFSQTFDLTKQGIGDINAGLIRCPINPDITIGIDARRILRAIKFAIKFDFSIENKLKEAMVKHRENITLLPSKFVSAKIDEIVQLDADKGIDKLIEFGLLKLTPLSKMVNDILIQKRKIIHSLSTRRLSSRVKIAAKPVFDFKALIDQFNALGTRINTLTDPKLKLDLANMWKTIQTRIQNLEPVVQKNDDHEIKTPEFWRKNLDYNERQNKQAFIRGDCGKGCPFGLTPIPDVCRSVGDTILRMTPIEELDKAAKDKYTRANKIVYAYCKERKHCRFLDKAMDDKFHKVDCNYGDNAAGFQSANLQGSPIYPSTFNSMMLSGLSSRPLGLYTDNSAARNMFFGLFSYLGKQKYTNMIKICKDIGLTLKLIASKHK